MFFPDPKKITIATNKNNSLNLILFISHKMGYNLIKGKGFRPFPCHLRAVIKLASPVKNVPIAINSSISNLIMAFFFFRFFLPIYVSPHFLYPL